MALLTFLLLCILTVYYVSNSGASAIVTYEFFQLQPDSSGLHTQLLDVDNDDGHQHRQYE